MLALRASGLWLLFAPACAWAGGRRARGCRAHGCQVAIARFLDCRCLALWASGLWLLFAPACAWVSGTWLPGGYSQIFRSYVFGPSGFWTMAPLRYAAKFAVAIAPPRPSPWHNPRKGRDQILPSGNLAQEGRDGGGEEEGCIIRGGPGCYPGSQVQTLRAAGPRWLSELKVMRTALLLAWLNFG